MDKRKLKISLKIIISCIFAAYLIFKVDLFLLLNAIGNTDVSLYLISSLLAVFSSIIVASKYYCLIRGSLIEHSLVALVKINFITRFYALFLPSAVGREAIRWVKVTYNQKDKAFFLASIIFERLTFIFVLLLCGLVPLFFYKSNPEIAHLRMKILPAGAIALGVVSILISIYIFQPIRSLINPLLNAVFQRIRKILDVDSHFEEDSFKIMNSKTFFYMVALSLIWQIFFICRLWILIRATSVPLSFMDITWIGSLVLLLQTIPISFAGIGLREGAYAYLFTLFNLPPEKGVLIGILFFSQMLIIAFVGGICELLE